MRIKFFSLLFLFFAACDNRPTLSTGPTGGFFEIGATIVKDDNTSLNLFEAEFKRNGHPYDSASILFSGQPIPSLGGGSYRAYSPGLNVPDGLSPIVFAVARDNYSSSVTIEMPGRFAITSITPRNNPAGLPVLVQWSAPSARETVWYFVSVIGKNYRITGVRPISYYAANLNRFDIPESAFQDQLGSFKYDTYYVYVGAFTRGFLPFENMPIPIPDSLPTRHISNPRGEIGYGRICARDSIFVSL